MKTKIQFGDTTRYLPQSWNELTLSQQLECYNILTAGAGPIFAAHEVPAAKRIALISRLLMLDAGQMEDWQKDCHQAEGSTEDGNLVFFAELAQLLSTVDFLFDITEEVEEDDTTTLFQVKLGLTKCPWPKLEYKSAKGKKKLYYAPGDELDNISLHELAYTFSIFERYLDTNKEEDANELIAAIYRPSKPSTVYNKQSGYEGDRRQPLYKHEAMIRKRQKRVAALPIETRRLILFWFASCRQHIINSYPNIFTPPSNMEIAGEKVGNDYGWGGMLLSLAGGIIHLEEISRQPYQNGFVYLSYLEDERMKQEMRAAFKK